MYIPKILICRLQMKVLHPMCLKDVWKDHWNLGFGLKLFSMVDRSSYQMRGSHMHFSEVEQHEKLLIGWPCYQTQSFHLEMFGRALRMIVGFTIVFFSRNSRLYPLKQSIASSGRNLLISNPEKYLTNCLN